MDFFQIIRFWFTDIDPSSWWQKDEVFDQLIRDQFMQVHQSVVAGEQSFWRNHPEGRLAEVIVLDQFSRNMFRNSKQAFGYDALALFLSQEAIFQGDDKLLTPTKRLFLYMPFMHSESRHVHRHAVELFTDLGLPDNLAYELKHKAIIDRFGRYPHRNKILGRESTAEEIEFLKQAGSSF